LFTPEDEVQIRKRLDDVSEPVKLILFTQTADCETCSDTETILRALSELSPKLNLEIYDLQKDQEKAEQFKVTRAPTIVLEGDRDYGIRFMGIPAGYEFASLLEDIVSIGKRQSGLSQESREKVQALKEPLNLKVFVTPG
jgi:glutaredoxin-like protein